MSQTIDWESDLDNAKPVGTAKERLLALLAEVEECNEAIRTHEDELELKKERLTTINRMLLPELLDEMGLSEIKLEDKTKITIGKAVQASVKKSEEHRFFDWLQANSFGGLIKSTVTAEFERDEIDKANAVVGQLRNEDITAALKQGVHPATLKAFVKERLEAGETLPDSVTVFEFREAKIVLPKRKK